MQETINAGKEYLLLTKRDNSMLTFLPLCAIPLLRAPFSHAPRAHVPAVSSSLSQDDASIWPCHSDASYGQNQPRDTRCTQY